MRQAMQATGIDDQAGQLIVANASHKFPAAPTEMTARAAARQRAPDRPADNADWDKATVLEDLDRDR
jgi:hypothetical protein